MLPPAPAASWGDGFGDTQEQLASLCQGLWAGSGVDIHVTAGGGQAGQALCLCVYTPLRSSTSLACCLDL